MPGSDGAAAATEPAIIAGYRVLRRLAFGQSATVYLGHADGSAHAAGTGAGAAGISTVALRVFHADAERERVDREIALLGALPAGVGAELHDVATLSDGRVCLVMQRDDGPTLAELLRRRTQIRAGEAVTILAPLVVSLDALHRKGWSHGALGPATVRFDTAGRTHLCGWSGARPLPAGAQRTSTLRAEYAALASIARAVCACVDRGSAAPHEAQEMLDWFDERVAAHPFLPCAAELERRLFALARPLPVRLATEPPDTSSTVQPAMPMRLTGEPATDVHPRTTSLIALDGDEPDRPPAVLWAGWALPGKLGERLDALRSMVRRRVGAHRRPIMVSAAVAAGLFALAITLLPPGSPGSQAAATPAPTAPVAPGPPEVETEPLQTADAALEADPVMAAAGLLAAREDCFRQSSLLCLDDVLDTGGPLAAADAADIRQAQLDGTVLLPDPYDLDALGLVEQNGGAALIALRGAGAKTKPASLLMIRGEAGWRLRELFDY
ncbi:hypothetical protein [Microterricola viridarii]|uniref:Protein kinase domain-containing protein n=1 Tax=Microterricola viridarii TaxID=412690 RepID=A0A109QYN6_9MICO|nr:hypothetical protein [Microterricola viridarii]AMB58560.1 hypothetical protein AWU67_06465 [Microterricola viridarii]